MEWITGIVNSDNFVKLVLFILILVATAIALVKAGILNIKTNHVTIGGNDSDERVLIRNQMEYLETSCKAQYKKILGYCDGEFHARFIISEVIDLFQQMVIYNHIDANDECYVRSKKNLVLMTIQNYAHDEHFFTPEFRSCCDKFVEDLIRDLFNMKKIFYK